MEQRVPLHFIVCNSICKSWFTINWQHSISSYAISFGVTPPTFIFTSPHRNQNCRRNEGEISLQPPGPFIFYLTGIFFFYKKKSGKVRTRRLISYLLFKKMVCVSECLFFIFSMSNSHMVTYTETHVMQHMNICKIYVTTVLVYQNNVPLFLQIFLQCFSAYMLKNKIDYFNLNQRQTKLFI